MKCTGTITQFEPDPDDPDFSTFHFEITDAIVELDQIAIDWIEDGEKYHAKLRSSDKGIRYEGNFGCPQPIRSRVISASRYDSFDGTVLLLASYRMDGEPGRCIFELVSSEERPSKPAKVTLAQLVKRVEALERDFALLKARHGL